MGLLELIEQKSFLGREFLTWLWYRAETDPVLKLDDGQDCEVEMLDPLQLDAAYGDARSTLLRGLAPATSPEAGISLRQGKKVRKARMRFFFSGADWIGTLDAETLAVSGLKLPKVGRLPFEEALQLRVEYLTEFENLLAVLYDNFLHLRLDESQWSKELDAIHKWVGSKS